MMRIPLNETTIGEAEIQAVVDVMKSTFVTMGKNCAEFEKEFAKYIGSKEAVYVNSGSSANLLAVFALAYQIETFKSNKRKFFPGCEIIVPAMTWSTTIWPIVQVGATPVLVDSDPATLEISVAEVEKAITDKTVAIMPVHILGNSAPMKQLKELADRHGLWLIEDTCESLGTTHYGKKAGAIGDMGTYSFFFSHHITSIEGGMIVTDDEDLADNLRSLRAHGWIRTLKKEEYYKNKYPDIDPRFLFITAGFNVRPTEVNAVIGRMQLKKLDGFNISRNKVANQWRTAFADLEKKGELTFPVPMDGSEPQWFGFPALCKNKETRKKLQAHLEAQGIETRPIICGNLARQPAFEKINHRKVGDLKGADTIMDKGLYWGLHPNMTNEQISYVIEKVQGFFHG